jgi:hypothetical protein
MEALGGFVGIVRSAAESEVVDGGRAAGGVRDDVMELEEFSLGAAALLATKRAAAPVALPHQPFDVGRNVPGVGSGRSRRPRRR